MSPATAQAALLDGTSGGAVVEVITGRGALLEEVLPFLREELGLEVALVEGNGGRLLVTLPAITSV